MTTDMYTRPSRAEIAARVNGQLPGAEPAPPARKGPPKPLSKTPTNVADAFRMNLAGALRKRGWTQAALAERSGIDKTQISRVLDGRSPRPSIVLAAAVADALGISLDDMTRPYVCGTCQGAPPAGYSCLECGTEGERL